MKRLSLAGKYRPQTFADVIGQELATAALSRVAAASNPAPAYLLSGTRGVGKTTIARIFAKALNCAKGPAAEPCNECSQCRHIVAGNHVDVCEIDGASNTGVDDVRGLRENLGYLPMEGKFKVFIVDEAHMLSKSAFNALLKTLEEPPGHTVFIFATTEAHRFPPTIVSRCQHFVFKHLPENMLFEHLCNILNKENTGFEEGAVRLIAKRAQGSVRDSLSLLDQVLALGSESLTETTARSALGLAGQEFFADLFLAISECNCTKVISLSRGLLLSGADLSFFARELAAWTRNLFLYKQEGDKILAALNLSSDEGAFVKKYASFYTSGFLHAAWQLVLNSQRSIAQSPEPGVVLELLLLNMAQLPQLLPVEAAKISVKTQTNECEKPAAENKQTEWHLAETAEYNASETKFAKDWDMFRSYCLKIPAEDAPPSDILRLLKADWKDNRLVITPPGERFLEKLQQNRRIIEKALESYCQGELPEIVIENPPRIKTQEDMIEECSKKPEIKLCQTILGASIKECHEK